MTPGGKQLPISKNVDVKFRKNILREIIVSNLNMIMTVKNTKLKCRCNAVTFWHQIKEPKKESDWILLALYSDFESPTTAKRLSFVPSSWLYHF